MKKCKKNVEKSTKNPKKWKSTTTPDFLKDCLVRCCLVSSFFGWCCCFPSPVWWCCFPSPPLGEAAFPPSLLMGGAAWCPLFWGCCCFDPLPFARCCFPFHPLGSGAFLLCWCGAAWFLPSSLSGVAIHLSFGVELNSFSSFRCGLRSPSLLMGGAAWFLFFFWRWCCCFSSSFAWCCFPLSPLRSGACLTSSIWVVLLDLFGWCCSSNLLSGGAAFLPSGAAWSDVAVRNQTEMTQSEGKLKKPWQ